YDDATACVNAFRTARRLDGGPAGGSFRTSLSSRFFALLDYGRRSGALDNLSAAFVRDPVAHRIASDPVDPDEVGKAIPEPVIRQLDAHLDTLGQHRAHGRR